MQENIGVLLHKLTKYQTLLSNTGSHQKKDIYNQKINSYSQKLNKIGVNQSNINQLGGLIGGLTAQEMQEKLAEARRQKESISSSLVRPDSNINSKVQLIGSRFADTIATLKADIQTNKETIEKLTSENQEKVKKIEQLELNIGDLTTQRDTLIGEKTLLEQIANESVNEFEDLTKTFMEYKKSVEEYNGETSDINNTTLDNLLSGINEIAEPAAAANTVYESLGAPPAEAPVEAQVEAPAEAPAPVEAPAPAEAEAQKPQVIELQQPQEFE
jgi:chromosome segregation ATPase